ncbi:MAG: PLP-dependent aspartate aminotransferase family protein [Bacteriovoracaceae bacterium]|nr:PLP-dependent aspartate aminotransferase family protein [Bacteriovoracaceae bacterium]
MTHLKKENSYSQYGMATKSIHAGGAPDPVTGSIMPAIHQTSTFVQSAPGEHLGYEYSRSHNPTRTRLEECLAAIESADYALATSSGMSITTLIMHMLPVGSNVICGDDVYGGTNRLFNKVFQNIHHFSFVDTTQLNLVEEIIKSKKPKLFWLETPTNPMLKISDVQKIAALCKAHDCLLCVDNTFMSPYFQRPLTLGADIVMHSITKYINGHSDVVGGCLMTNRKDLYEKLWFLQNATGPSQSPFDSWLVLRGLKTLSVRMERHAQNAQKIAEMLAKHTKIEKVYYPGLPEHPGHEIAKKQMSGFGGMITFVVKGGLTPAKQVLSKVKLFSLAESLGGVESLIEHPAIMTHASVPADQRAKLGISDGLLRISVGIEDVEDLIKDLDNALS